jgi:competence protein ComEA
MSFPNLVTPAELRLAILLFLLGTIGTLVRTAEKHSPEVERWLHEQTSPARADTASVADPEPTADPDSLPVEVVAETGSGPPASGSGIDPSTASLAALRTLPGVGPVLAARIIEDRVRNGPYRTPDDLRRVKGIGEATLERIRGNLFFPDR